MANALAGNIWTIDTAGASALGPKRALLSSITLSGYTTATHTAVFEADGSIAMTLTGNTDLTPITVELDDVWVSNPKITTLDSGEVNIAVK